MRKEARGCFYSLSGADGHQRRLDDARGGIGGTGQHGMRLAGGHGSARAVKGLRRRRAAIASFIFPRRCRRMAM
jgi:hypothetical protein